MSKSNETESPDFDNRYSEGKESIIFYVKEVPEDCEGCPLYIKNINQDKIMNNDPTFYCFFRSSLVSAQYGGIDVSDPATYTCPLVALVDSEEYIDHEERITALEEAVAALGGNVSGGGSNSGGSSGSGSGGSGSSEDGGHASAGDVSDTGSDDGGGGMHHEGDVG